MDYSTMTQASGNVPLKINAAVEGVTPAHLDSPKDPAPPAEEKADETPAPDAPKEDGNATVETPNEGGETKAPDQEHSSEKKDPFAPRFAALSKRDKELRSLERELKERGEKIKHVEEAISKAKEDPEGLFQVAGITYEQIVQHYLQGEKAPQDSKLKTLEEKLNALEAEKNKEKEERSKSEQQQKIDAFYGRIDTYLNEGADKYELTRLFVTPQEIYNEMVAHYTETEKSKGYGETITIAQAVESIEKRLETEIIEKSKNSSKIKKLLGQIIQPEEGENPSPKQSDASKAVLGARTLSNAHLSDRPTGQARRLSREESIRELAKKLEFYQ